MADLQDKVKSALDSSEKALFKTPKEMVVSLDQHKKNLYLIRWTLTRHILIYFSNFSLEMLDRSDVVKEGDVSHEEMKPAAMMIRLVSGHLGTWTSRYSVLEISILNNKNNLIEFKNIKKIFLHVDVVYTYIIMWFFLIVFN
jgi:hypothetical protein